MLFSLPFMLSNTLQVSGSIVDMIVIGRALGSSALTAVSTAAQVVSFMTLLSVGFSIGAQVWIAQLAGAGRDERLPEAAGTFFTVTALIAAVMTLLGLTCAGPVLRLMRTPQASFAMAQTYLCLNSAGMLLTYGSSAVAAVLRGLGNSRQPCLYAVTAAVVKLGLELLLVVYWDCGVAGAALATMAGQGAALLWALVWLHRSRARLGFAVRTDCLRPDAEAVRMLLKLGIPFALRSASVNLSMMVVTGMVNGLGMEDAAAFGVGLRVDEIVRQVSLSVNYAVSTMVGQNAAAGERTRTRKVVLWGWVESLAICALFALVLGLWKQELFGLFTDDERVIGYAAVFVGAILWSFPAQAIMRGTNGFVQGLGCAGLSLLFSVLDGIVLRIGLSWLLGIVWGLGVYGFWLGYGLATYGSAVPGLWYFLSGRWKRRIRRDIA